MAEDRPSRQRTRRGVLVWTLLAAAVTTAIAFDALRDRPQLPPPEADVPVETPPTDQAFALPNDPPDLPLGPHREEFAVSCTICHSTRLIANQPHFPQKKWGEIVHKMVDVYGAPLAPDDEARIVEYLMTMRGRPE